MHSARGFVISTLLYLVIMVIAAALFISFGYKLIFKEDSSPNPPNQVPADVQDQQTDTKINDEALKNALNTYVKAKQSGTNFSSGPCLGIVAPDWVLDIAHNPRQPIDDKQENQCAEFSSGQAHHFIELDPDGKLIRAK